MKANKVQNTVWLLFSVILAVLLFQNLPQITDSVMSSLGSGKTEFGGEKTIETQPKGGHLESKRSRLGEGIQMPRQKSQSIIAQYTKLFQYPGLISEENPDGFKWDREIMVAKAKEGARAPDIWDKVNSLSSKATNKAVLPDSLPIAREAVRLARDHFGADSLVCSESLRDLAIVSAEQGLFEDALKANLGAIEVAEIVLSKGHPYISELWLNSGGILISLGSFEDAIKVLTEADARLHAVLPDNHRLIGRCADLLGVAYKGAGEFGLALQFAQSAVEIEQHVTPEDNRSLLVAILNLGNVHSIMGQFEQAISCYTKSMILARRLGSNIDIAHVYSAFGAVYDNLGRYSDAIDSHNKALSILNKELPSNHLEIGHVFYDMGYTLSAMKRYEDALPYLNNALAILIRALPENHLRWTRKFGH